MKYYVFQLLKEGQNKLASEGISEIEARYLLEKVLNKDFTNLLMAYQDEVSEIDEKCYRKWLDLRIKRYPLQYITHEQNFMGYNFYVNENVLIPRPETELLVEKSILWIESLIREGLKKFSILDMCTGSGCIIISLYRQIEDKGWLSEKNGLDFQFVAADLSQKAIEVAKKNEILIMNLEKIHWIQTDLFNEINQENRFELIISNPPYISIEDVSELNPEVKDYEPRMALEGGADGLVFYRKLAQASWDYLQDRSMLLLEIGNGQMREVKEMLRTKGFTTILGSNDFYGLERVVSGIKLNKPD